jgi:hypothetical protein
MKSLDDIANIPASMVETARMIDHMLHGRFHLIPSPEEMNNKIADLSREYIYSGSGADHRKIVLLCFPHIHPELEEWLRVQMFNRRTADEINHGE